MVNEKGKVRAVVAFIHYVITWNVVLESVR